MIHESAIIDSTAVIGKNVTVGPWTIIGADVVVGDDCNIGPHVVLKGPTILGSNNKIYQFVHPTLIYPNEELMMYTMSHPDHDRPKRNIKKKMSSAGPNTKVCLFKGT